MSTPDFSKTPEMSVMTEESSPCPPAQNPGLWSMTAFQRRFDPCRSDAAKVYCAEPGPNGISLLRTRTCRSPQSNEKYSCVADSAGPCVNACVFVVHFS